MLWERRKGIAQLNTKSMLAGSEYLKESFEPAVRKWLLCLLQLKVQNAVKKTLAARRQPQQGAVKVSSCLKAMLLLLY